MTNLRFWQRESEGEGQLIFSQARLKPYAFLMISLLQLNLNAQYLLKSQFQYLIIKQEKFRGQPQISMEQNSNSLDGSDVERSKRLAGESQLGVMQGNCYEQTLEGYKEEWEDKHATLAHVKKDLAEITIEWQKKSRKNTQVFPWQFLEMRDLSNKFKDEFKTLKPQLNNSATMNKKSHEMLEFYYKSFQLKRFGVPQDIREQPYQIELRREQAEEVKVDDKIREKLAGAAEKPKKEGSAGSKRKAPSDLIRQEGEQQSEENESPATKKKRERKKTSKDPQILSQFDEEDSYSSSTDHKAKKPSRKKKGGAGSGMPKPPLPDPQKILKNTFKERHLDKFHQAQSLLSKFGSLSVSFEEWIFEGIVNHMIQDYATYEKHIFEMIPSMVDQMSKLGSESNVGEMLDLVKHLNPSAGVLLHLEAFKEQPLLFTRGWLRYTLLPQISLCEDFSFIRKMNFTNQMQTAVDSISETLRHTPTDLSTNFISLALQMECYASLRKVLPSQLEPNQTTEGLIRFGFCRSAAQIISRSYKNFMWLSVIRALIKMHENDQLAYATILERMDITADPTQQTVEQLVDHLERLSFVKLTLQKHQPVTLTVAKLVENLAFMVQLQISDQQIAEILEHQEPHKWYDSLAFKSSGFLSEQSTTTRLSLGEIKLMLLRFTNPNLHEQLKHLSPQHHPKPQAAAADQKGNHEDTTHSLMKVKQRELEKELEKHKDQFKIFDQLMELSEQASEKRGSTYDHKPYQVMIAAACIQVTKYFTLLNLSTSSGKSYIIMLIVLYYNGIELLNGDKIAGFGPKKFLLVVSSPKLQEQAENIYGPILSPFPIVTREELMSRPSHYAEQTDILIYDEVDELADDYSWHIQELKPKGEGCGVIYCPTGLWDLRLFKKVMGLTATSSPECIRKFKETLSPLDSTTFQLLIFKSEYEKATKNSLLNISFQAIDKNKPLYTGVVDFMIKDQQEIKASGNEVIRKQRPYICFIDSEYHLEFIQAVKANQLLKDIPIYTSENVASLKLHTMGILLLHPHEYRGLNTAFAIAALVLLGCLINHQGQVNQSVGRSDRELGLCEGIIFSNTGDNQATFNTKLQLAQQYTHVTQQIKWLEQLKNVALQLASINEKFQKKDLQTYQDILEKGKKLMQAIKMNYKIKTEKDFNQFAAELTIGKKN